MFPHDGESYETLLATADGRMYRDKARRKRQSGERSQKEATTSLSDTDLQRAAVGIL